LADVYAIVSNHAVYTFGSAVGLYTRLRHANDLKMAMEDLDTSMYNIRNAFIAHFANPDASKPPMSYEAYEKAISSPPAVLAEILAQQRTLEQSDTSVAYPRYVVYGRHDAKALQAKFPHLNLKPCPFTQKADALLASHKLPFETIEVQNAFDGVPLRKDVKEQLAHTTVPVIFKKASEHALPEFIGGFSDLEASLGKAS
jgi:hypothetical protein